MTQKAPDLPAYPQTVPDEFIEDEGFDFRRPWGVVWGRKWAILGLAFAAGLFSVVFSHTLQPIYRSTATLLIGANAPVIESSVERGFQSYRARFFQTQIELLASREVARGALGRLRDQNPSFDPLPKDEKRRFNWQDWIPRSWGTGLRAPHLVVVETDPDRALLGWLRDGLTIEPVRDTSMVRVSFESHDPSLAARVVNAVAGAYIQTNLTERRALTEKASEWLQEQLKSSQKTIENTAAALQRYRAEARLIGVEGIQELNVEELRALTQEFLQARKNRMEKENLFTRAASLKASGRLDAMPEVASDGRVQALQAKERELVLKLRLDGFHDGFDAPGRPREELQAVREEIDRTLTQIIDGMKMQYEIALTNEKTLETALGELQEKVQDLNKNQFEIEGLERVLQTQRQSYDTFLNRLIEMTAQNADTITLVARIVDRAVPELYPVKPNKRVIVTMAVLLALLLGIGLAFLLDKLDDTLKTRTDLEQRLGLPVLGLVPILEKGADKHKAAKDQVPPGTVFVNNPGSSFAESIRTIRTGIALSRLGRGAQVLLVTSTVSGDGKTTVALNLALAFAKLHKVLLIDADLRSPTIDKLVGLDLNCKGLADLVAGTADMGECVYSISGNINVLPAGSVQVPNPLELLSSEQFAKVVQDALSTHDTVILDSAPALPVSDARVLSRLSSGVVYVAKAEHTSYRAARRALAEIVHAGANVIGLVLNGVEPKASEFGAYARYAGTYHHYGSGLTTTSDRMSNTQSHGGTRVPEGSSFRKPGVSPID